MTKTKVIALNTIVKTVKAGVRGDRNKGDPGTKPEVMTIEPGTTFMADTVRHGGSLKSEYDELKASDSIRDWTQADEDALSRLSNVVGGGEFTDNFKVSETVVSANEGQQSLPDPAGTGTNAASGVKKSTPPAPKQAAAAAAGKETGNAGGSKATGKAPTAAEKKAAEEEAARIAAEQAGENGSGDGEDGEKEDDVV